MCVGPRPASSLFTSIETHSLVSESSAVFMHGTGDGGRCRWFGVCVWVSSGGGSWLNTKLPRQATCESPSSNANETMIKDQVNTVCRQRVATDPAGEDLGRRARRGCALPHTRLSPPRLADAALRPEPNASSSEP